MTKTLTFLLALIFAITSFGQSFEGKIVYKNIYKSKMPNVTAEQLTTMMGSTQEYFIKKGDYKSMANGSFLESNSLPLKSIIDNGQFTSESVAVEVKEMKLDDTLFELPANSKTMKSPY